MSPDQPCTHIVYSRTIYPGSHMPQELGPNHYSRPYRLRVRKGIRTLTKLKLLNRMDRQTQGLTGAHMVLSHQRVASIRGSVGSASHQDQNDAPLGSPDIVVLKVPKTSVGASKPAEPDRETQPPFNGIFSSTSETRKKIEKEFNYQQQAEKEVAKLFSFATPAPSTVVSRRHSDEQNGGRKETIVSKKSDTRRSFVALGASKPVSSTMKSTLQALGNSSSSFQHVSHNIFSAVHKASFPVDQDPVPVQGTTNQQGSPHKHVQEEMKPVVSPVPNSVPLIPQRMSHEVATEDEERVNNFGMQYTEFSNAPIELRDPEEYHTNRYPSSQNQLSSQEVMDNIPDEPQVEGSLASQEHQRGYEDFVKNLSTYERTHSGQKTECITRWQTSSLEDWKEGKREITEKLNQILEATRAYMKRKSSVYAELDGGIDAHHTQLVKRRKVMEEKGKYAASTCATLLERVAS